MTARRVASLLAVAAAMGIAACGAPAPTAAPSAAAPTSAPPASSRPRSISVAALDPCAVFTPDQLRTLQISRQNTYPRAANGQCGWTDVVKGEFVTVGTQVLTTMGIDEVRKRLPEPPSDVTVQGFPALQRRLTDIPDTPAAEIVIDVADGQLLGVSVSLGGAENGAKALHETQVAADFAMTNLLSRQEPPP